MVSFNGEVRGSSELRRILALPRRKLDDPKFDGLAEEMTALLKRDGGTQRLKPIQALALYEIGTYGGAFCPVGVGEGKTLISLLSFYVLDAERPLLILPAALIKKTAGEAAKYREHWLVPDNIVMVSYEALGRVSNATFLEQYNPDVIVADECHRLKSKKAACTRRMTRFMKESNL